MKIPQLALVFSSLTSLLPAANLYWDTNGTATGATNTSSASGSWAGTNWNSLADGTGALNGWINGSAAYFSAGSNATGTTMVTLSAPVSVSSLFFEDGTTILSGSSISFSVVSPLISVSASRSATLSTGLSTSSGSLEKTGSGQLTLSQPISGLTTLTLSQGAWFNGADNLLPDTSTVGLVGGDWDLGGYSETVSALAGTGRVFLSGGTLTLSSAAATSFSGDLDGQGTLVKSGSGNLTLSLGKAPTGTVSLQAGTLTLGSVNTLNNSTLDATGGTLALGVPGTNTYVIGALSGSLPIALGANTVAGGQNGANTLYSGVLSGSGRLQKEGTGTLTLTSAQTYTGQTRVLQGILNVGNGGTTGSLPGSVQTSGGTLRFNRFDAIVFPGVISGAGAVAIKNLGGAGSYVNLSGANTYSGGTTVEANSSLLLGNASALGTGPVTLGTGSILFGASHPLNLAQLAGLDSDGTAIATTTGGYTYNSAAAGTVRVRLQGATGLTKSGTGILTLSGDNSYSGVTTVNSGVLDINGPTALGAANVVNNGTFVWRGGPTLANLFSGAGTLDMQYLGITTLTAANTHTGETRVFSGTLALGHVQTLQNSTLTLFSGGAVSFPLPGSNTYFLGGLSAGSNIALGSNTLSIGGSNSDSIYAGSLSGTGGLIKTGTGTLTLAAANTHFGSTTVTGGILSLMHHNALAASLVVLAGGSLQTNLSDSQTFSLGGLEGTGGVSFNKLQVTVSSNTSFGGTLSGNSFAKSGPATLTLSAPTLFTGDTFVASGPLALAHTQALAGSSLYLDTNASLSLAASGSNTYLLTALSGPGTVALGGNSLKLTGASEFSLFSGTLSGTGSLIKEGAASLNLSGSSPFSGTLSLLAGNTVIRGAGNFPGSSSLEIASGASLSVQNSQTFSGLTGAGTLELQLAGLPTESFTVGAGNASSSFTGRIIGQNLPVRKIGTGTLTLSDGTSTFANLQLEGGSVALANISAAASSTVHLAGGTLAFAVAGTNSYYLGGLSGASALTFGANTVLVGDNNTSTTYSGVATGTGSFVKRGSGVLTLTGQNNLARVVPEQGTLSLGHASALATATLDLTTAGANVFFVLPGTNAYQLGGLSGSEFFSFGSNSLTVGGNNATTTFSGSLTGSGALTKTGAGTLTLSASNSSLLTGTTTVSGGTLALGHHNILGGSRVVMAGGSLTFPNNPPVVPGVAGLSGSGAVTFDVLDVAVPVNSNFGGTLAGNTLFVNGPTRLNLTAPTQFSGSLKLEGGTLALSHPNAIANASLEIKPTATLELAGTPGDYSVASLLGSGTVSLGGLNLRVDPVSGGSTFSGTLTVSGELIKDGAGSLTLDGQSPFAGWLNVRAGLVTVRTDNNFSGASGLEIAAAGSAQVYDNQAFALLIGAGSLQLLMAAPDTFTVGGGNGSSTFSGPVSGSGSLVKSGSGTVTLSGTPSYTGSTTVTGGTLAFTTTRPTSSVFVLQNNATLAATVPGLAATSLTGTGNLSGATTVSATLSPGGTSAGRLAVTGNLTLGPACATTLQLGGPTAHSGTAGTHDVISATGTVTLDGSLTVGTFNGFSPSSGQAFRLVQAASINTAAFNVNTDLVLPGLESGLTWDRSAFATTGTVSVLASSYASFLNDHFNLFEQLNSFVSGPNADPDGDGLPNLLEYALATDPRSVSSRRLPAATVATQSGSSYAALSYVRTKGGSDLTFTPQFSSTPDAASFASGAFTTVSTVDNGDGTQTVTVRDNTALTATSKRFLRILISN